MHTTNEWQAYTNESCHAVAAKQYLRGTWQMGIERSPASECHPRESKGTRLDGVYIECSHKIYGRLIVVNFNF